MGQQSRAPGVGWLGLPPPPCVPTRSVLHSRGAHRYSHHTNTAPVLHHPLGGRALTGSVVLRANELAPAIASAHAVIQFLGVLRRCQQHAAALPVADLCCVLPRIACLATHAAGAGVACKKRGAGKPSVAAHAKRSQRLCKPETLWVPSWTKRPPGAPKKAQRIRKRAGRAHDSSMRPRAGAAFQEAPATSALHAS